MPEQALTVVVNVEPPLSDAEARNIPGPAVLGGVRITHEEPIIDSLVAFGVPIDEIPRWKLYTGEIATETEAADNRTVGLDIAAIWTAMIKRADKLGLDHTTEAFKPVTAEDILFRLAQGVVLADQPKSFWRRRNGDARQWPVLVSGAVSITGIVASSSTEYYNIVAPAALCLVGVGGLAKYTHTSRYAAMHLIWEASKTKRHLAHNIEQVLLPIYQ